MRFLLILLSGLTSASMAFGAPSADEIMSRAYGLPKANDMSSTITMTLKQSGGVKTRTIKSSTRKTEAGNDSLAEFLSPADVSGTKFLTIGNKKEGDNQRLYLPALGKIRKIAASGKNGKFMGSDFTYYDMEEHSQEDFTFSSIGIDQLQTIRNGTSASIPCYVIQSVPKKTDSPYSKSILWVAEDDYFTYKSEMYDKSGALDKTILIQEVKTISGILVALKTVALSASGSSTAIQTADTVINGGVNPELFGIQYLEK
jgi:outer membrane lipoprotein-sorting protein